MPSSLLSTNTAPFESQNRHFLCQQCVGHSCPHADHMTKQQVGRFEKKTTYVHCFITVLCLESKYTHKLTPIMGSSLQIVDYKLCRFSLIFVYYVGYSFISMPNCGQIWGWSCDSRGTGSPFPYLSTTLSSQWVQQMEIFTFVLFTVVRFVPEEIDPYLPIHHSGGLILCFKTYVT